MRMINLRGLREARNWSRDELAKRANVSLAVIEKHEIKMPQDTYVSVAMKISAALGCSIESLFLKSNSGLRVNSAQLKADHLETTANLATARAEHQILTAMAIEDVLPELEQTALERLRELVRVHGKRNQYGHKQYKKVVFDGNSLFEVFEDGDPEPITESRAEQLLEVL